MATLREAILHVRSGGTARCGDKTVRLLTQEETNDYFLKHAPSRRVVRDETGTPVGVEEYGEGRPDSLGLWLFGGAAEPVQFSPSDEDIYEPIGHDENGNEKPRVLRTDWIVVDLDAVNEAPPEP